MPRGINLFDPEHIRKALVLYDDDLYWLKTARIAIHAMWEHKIIDDEEANELRRECFFKLKKKYESMRARPGKGLAKVGLVSA